MQSAKCHSEPFGCHSERSEESQGRLREESRPFAMLRVTSAFCNGLKAEGLKG